MNVLGFDTSTPFLAVAATRAGVVVAEARVAPDPETGRPRHSERLLAHVDEAVMALGGWGEVDRIAVGTGPGTYTGLRIGIATARALGQARGAPLAGVSSLSALAAGIRERGAGDHTALAVLDARREQAFAALHGRGGEVLWPPFVASPDDLAGRVRSLGEPPLAAGDGSLRFCEQLEAAGATVAAPGDEVHHVAARHVCALGAGVAPGGPGGIEPVYLRAPDAERWLERDN